MKFSLESRSDINIITSYDDDHIVIRMRNSPELSQKSLHPESAFILTPYHLDQDEISISEFTTDNIKHFKMLDIEVLIVAQNSGFLTLEERILFAEYLLPVESMSLGAACRTYNLLANEGRQVALIIRAGLNDTPK